MFLGFPLFALFDFNFPQVSKIDAQVDRIGKFKMVCFLVVEDATKAIIESCLQLEQSYFVGAVVDS